MHFFFFQEHFKIQVEMKYLVVRAYDELLSLPVTVSVYVNF